MHVTAIIVARGGSRRVPGKALRPFGGSSLIVHKVDQLRRCPSVSAVVVGSDDDEILDQAHRVGAEIRRRDAYHCDETQCSANEMIRNMVAMVETDVVLWAHPTNPLCGPEIYEEALAVFAARRARWDSLCSVTRIQRHAWRHGWPHVPINFDPWGPRHQLASELEPTFFQDGAIFIQPHRQMLENAYFYGRSPQLFEIEQPYGFDIDTEQDLVIAQAIHAGLGAGQ